MDLYPYSDDLDSTSNLRLSFGSIVIFRIRGGLGSDKFSVQSRWTLKASCQVAAQIAQDLLFFKTGSLEIAASRKKDLQSHEEERVKNMIICAYALHKTLTSRSASAVQNRPFFHFMMELLNFFLAVCTAKLGLFQPLDIKMYILAAVVSLGLSAQSLLFYLTSVYMREYSPVCKMATINEEQQRYDSLSDSDGAPQTPLHDLFLKQQEAGVQSSPPVFIKHAVTVPDTQGLKQRLISFTLEPLKNGPRQTFKYLRDGTHRTLKHLKDEPYSCIQAVIRGARYVPIMVLKGIRGLAFSVVRVACEAKVLNALNALSKPSQWACKLVIVTITVYSRVRRRRLNPDLPLLSLTRFLLFTTPEFTRAFSDDLTLMFRSFMENEFLFLVGLPVAMTSCFKTLFNT